MTSVGCSSFTNTNPLVVSLFHHSASETMRTIRLVDAQNTGDRQVATCRYGPARGG